MKSKFCAAVLLMAPLVSALQGHAGEAVDCKVKPFFYSQGSIGETVIEEFRKARSKLSVALYGFNNPALAEELVKLAERGVSVKVKIDAGKSAKRRTESIIKLLKSAGVRVEAVAEEGRNHNKFVVIDESKVITGSYNWTMRAEENWENVLVLDCAELAKMYEREWEAIK